MAHLRSILGSKRFELQLRVGDKRHTIRLGKVSRAVAESVKVNVESLAYAVEVGVEPDTRTLAWLDKIGPKLRARMAKAGLCESNPRNADVTLGAFVAAFLTDYTAGNKGTKKTIQVAANRLIRHFGADTLMRSISASKARECIESLNTRRTIKARKLSDASASTTVKKARQLWKEALKRGFVAENVWLSVPMGSQENEERGVYVPRGDIAKVIEQCPNAEWRLIVALSRFAGLRCPSEHLRLKVADIDWRRDRFRVRGKGGKNRWVPIFPELRPYLRSRVDELPAGESRLIANRADVTGATWRKQMLQFVAMAGIKEPWPRLWHNLRASCETDLVARGHPVHVVGKWLGHSEAIARRHYLQVTEEEFEKAADQGDQNKKMA